MALSSTRSQACIRFCLPGNCYQCYIYAILHEAGTSIIYYAGEMKSLAENARNTSLTVLHPGLFAWCIQNTFS